MSESCAQNNDHRRELEEWRGKIDAIDRQLAALLCQRLLFAGNISAVKTRIGETVLQPEREKEVLGNVLGQTESPIMAQALERIYNSILNESRLIQHECKGEQQSLSSR
ncbi:MAG: chorismate mutase [Chlorobiaceae bacterium]|nr:chorismate mutase [Chlorobiaceae bacterium]